MNAAPGPSPRPLLARLLIRRREYRTPVFWVRVRIACGVFNLCLGVVLLSFGRWEGVLALAGAALIFRTVFLLRHSVHG
jgi:hypothetical protein